MLKITPPLCAALAVLTCALPIHSAEVAPKLIVQITLDQFRADYLTRFSPAFSGGLKRMIDEGTIDYNGQIDHGISNSLPGHATLSTGAYPSAHGFSANEWWDFNGEQWSWVDGAADAETFIVGDQNRTSYSPLNLRSTSLGDWVKQANPNAKSISVAGSEVAVVYGGHSSDGTYWYDVSTRRFVTSTYYRTTYPEWISAFNDTFLPTLQNEEWRLTLPQEFISLAEPDNAGYENLGEHQSFPHRFVDIFDSESETPRDGQLSGWLAETPMRDIALVALGKAAIAGEQLGQRDTTDYLSITLSATDSIGHNFGGRSLEILDTLWQIDQALADLLNYLDQTLGKGNYVVAVSGDHGAPDPIEYTLANGGDAYRIPRTEIDELLNEVEAFGQSFVGSEHDLMMEIEGIIEARAFVADAITENEIHGVRATDNPYIHLFRNSWVEGRIPDFPLWGTGSNQVHHPARYGIYVQFKENTFFDWATVVHGSPYTYDRTVPIIFYGAGIEHGIINGARTLDVAPTLADLAKIDIPPTVDGKSVFDKRD